MDQVAGGIYPAVQIDGGEHGLRGVCQNGRALTSAAQLLTVAQLQVLAQLQILGHLVQALLAHQCGADAGQIALRQVGVLGVQVLRRHEAQHRIAQKLQTFVAGDAPGAVLVGVGAVVQGVFQQRGAAEGIAQLCLQCLHR